MRSKSGAYFNLHRIPIRFKLKKINAPVLLDILRNTMEYSRFGSLFALIGMILLLVINLTRRSARQKKSWTKTDVVIQKWGALAAYALIAMGLLLLLRRN